MSGLRARDAGGEDGGQRCSPVGTTREETRVTRCLLRSTVVYP